MIVAGIGCRSGVSAAEVERAIATALQQVARQGGRDGTNVPASGAGGTPNDQLQLIATPDTRAHEPGVVNAAAARGVPLLPISQLDLEAADARTLTQSTRSLSAKNVGSVAEAAALAGAGRSARLLGPRIAVGPVTCALATAAGNTQ